MMFMREDGQMGTCRIYNELNSQLDNYKDQQATINDQNNKLTEIQSQYDSLQADRDNLQQQVAFFALLLADTTKCVSFFNTLNQL